MCGGTRIRDLFRSDADVFRCEDCSHVFTDPASISHPEIYGREYYERTHRNWFANPNRELFSWIASRLPEGAASVLDVGCGKGAFLRFLRARKGGTLKLVGIDYSSNEVEDGVEFRQGDFTRMPGDERFDAVVSLAVIEHVEDPVAFARSLNRRCASNGMIAVMTLDNGSLLYATARLMARLGLRGPAERLYSAHHLQHFTRKSLRLALEKVGLEVVELHHHNAPLASIDVPASNVLVRMIFMAGVVLLFQLGLISGRTYLQTVVARRRGN